MPGLRAWIGLSRHSSVVSSVPRPLTSMLPPSSTMRRAPRPTPSDGVHDLRRSRFASQSLTASSFLWFGYFAQPLNLQLVIATSPSRSTSRTAGRSRASSCGRSARERSRSAPRSTPTRTSTARALRSVVASLTRMRTRSPRRQVAHDLAVDPRDRRELARPVGALVRPRQPGRLVRLPLGRHAVAELHRSLRRLHSVRRSDR